MSNRVSKTHRQQSHLSASVLTSLPCSLQEPEETEQVTTCTDATQQNAKHQPNMCQTFHIFIAEPSVCVWVFPLPQLDADEECLEQLLVVYEELSRNEAEWSVFAAARVCTCMWGRRETTASEDEVSSSFNVAHKHSQFSFNTTTWEVSPTVTAAVCYAEITRCVCVCVCAQV